MMCHEDPEMTMERNGKTISIFVQNSILQKSVHKDVDCAMCHEEADVEDFPHNDVLKPVSCESCHPSAEMQFNNGIQWLVSGRNPCDLLLCIFFGI